MSEKLLKSVENATTTWESGNHPISPRLLEPDRINKWIINLLCDGELPDIQRAATIAETLTDSHRRIPGLSILYQWKEELKTKASNS